MIDLSGKSALVTGAAFGIGRATARRLAQLGARVAAVDRDVARASETVAAIEADGGTAISITCDVSDEEQVAGMVATVLDTFGRLDIAHNNAAISPVTGNTAECSKAHWDAVMAVNLTGVWLCMKHEIPAMIATGGGSIINTSSGVGLSPMPNQPAYVTSKHGVIGITKAASLEFATAGIRINAICPGAVITGLTEAGLAEGKYTIDALGALSPMQRVGGPEEIADAVAWFASDAASFVTGAVLPVDGGTTVGLTYFGKR